MRPFERGSVPTDAAGNALTVTHYRDWRRDLIDRIGPYCAYCNMPLGHKLEVEHMSAQAQQLVNPLDWSNLALSCNTCNTTKNARPYSPATHYLPDRHNTHMAFVYVPRQRRRNTRDRKLYDVVDVEPAPGLTAAQQLKAQNTLDLVDINLIDGRRSIPNQRFSSRLGAWRDAEASLQDYEIIVSQAPAYSLQQARQIARTAKATGFFSLWFVIFSKYPEVLKLLVHKDQFPGTALNCFDSANGYRPVPRNPSDPVDPL